MIDRLERLVGLALRIHAEHTLERVFQEVADAARDVIGARYAAIGILDPAKMGLATFVTSGLSENELATIGPLPHGRGILGLLISNPPSHPAMKSFLGVPIPGRGGPMGNLYLTGKIGADEFSMEDEAIAMMLGAQAAVAVRNAEQHEESQRLLKEVRDMQASRDRFFAMINHELRNALTAVYGWADLLVRKGDAPRAAVEVHDSAGLTLTLLNDLLDLSRIEADRLKPVIRASDASELVREAASTVQPSVIGRGIRIVTTGPTGPVDCATDPQRVRQILVNLLTNAVRHSPDHGEVFVELHPSAERLRFDVVDRGEGIAPAQQASIFDAFIQADSTRECGTGLGLTLSRQLARLLGGDLRVESQVAVGSRFTLDITRHAARS